MGLLKRQTEQGDFRQAAETAGRLQGTAERLMGASNPDVIRLGIQRGILLRSAGDYQAAAEQLLSTLQSSSNRLGLRHPISGAAHNALGSIYRMQGKLKAARQQYQTSLTILEGAGAESEKDLAEAYANFCDLLNETGEFVESLGYGQKSLAINRRLFGEQNNATIVSLNNVGMTQIKLGQWKQAEANLSQSLATSEMLFGKEHVETAISLNNLGLLYSLRGRDEEAIRVYKRSLSIYENTLGKEHPATARIQNNLGQIYSDRGALDKAVELLRAALAVQIQSLGADHPSTATTRHNLGCTLMDLGQVERARGLLTQTAEFLEQSDSDRDANGAASRAFLGILEANANDPSAAIVQFNKSRQNANLSAWRMLPKLSSTEQHDFMRRRIDWTLYAALSLAFEFPNSQAVLAGSAQWLANGKSIAAEALIDSKRLSTPEQAERAKEQVSLEQIRRCLDADAVLIDFVRQDEIRFKGKSYSQRLGSARYVAWITPKEGDIRRIDLGDAAEIDSRIQEVRRLIVGGDKTKLAEQTRELSQAIWIPLQEVLPDEATHLWLSLDGDLWLVPWAAMHLSDGRLLVQSYSSCTLGSGRELVDRRSQAPEKTSPPATFANPDFDLSRDDKRGAYQAIFRRPPVDDVSTKPWNILNREELHAGPLPGTITECEAIKPSLAKWLDVEPVVYQGRYALESVAKKVVSPRVLVFATHGFFIDDQEKVFDPLQRCGLVLSGFNDMNSVVGTDDGVLTGSEIAQLELTGTELVVLSACNTGVGRIEDGNGVAGLRRAFELAGCDCVISTLWSIPDLGTAELMSEFFRQLANGLPKAKALQAAQLAQMGSLNESDSDAPPFRWAGFTVSGGK
jgi:CHAT domain-containing protein/Tfp pilus assembly protein PilF